MAGQGTAALELIEDEGQLDVLIVPVGGGGLISGCATIAVARSPGVRVIGVEPAAGDDVRQSLALGTRSGSTCRAPSPTASRPRRQGCTTSRDHKRTSTEIVTVSDADIVDAMRLLRDGRAWPSQAVPLPRPRCSPDAWPPNQARVSV